jgi:hypothetical protein
MWIVLKFVQPVPMVIETPVLIAIGPFATEAEAVLYNTKHDGYRVIELKPIGG